MYWVLDALFNGRAAGPRLLFKGGTSLSKGFGLIRPFSEDIVTVFRDDFGQAFSIAQLAELEWMTIGAIGESAMQVSLHFSVARG